MRNASHFSERDRFAYYVRELARALIRGTRPVWRHFASRKVRRARQRSQRLRLKAQRRAQAAARTAARAKPWRLTNWSGVVSAMVGGGAALAGRP